MVDKSKNYITPHGYAKLMSERDALVKIERPEVTKVVAWAASLGDRSENADYQYGKKRLREIDRRVSFLNKRINSAVVVEQIQQQVDRVQFGASVTVSDEDGMIKRFIIVGEDESEPKHDLISWKSPIGSKLLGRQCGDSVTIRTPGGEKEMEVISIEYKIILFPEVEK